MNRVLRSIIKSLGDTDGVVQTLFQVTFLTCTDALRDTCVLYSLVLSKPSMEKW